MRETRTSGQKDLVTCDVCGLEHEVESASEWSKKGRHEGWIIVNCSPVTFGGMDVCPKCSVPMIVKVDEMIHDLKLTHQASMKHRVVSRLFAMLVDAIMFGGADEVG